MTAQETIKIWITENPRSDGESDEDWRLRCKAAHKDMPGSTFSDGWYKATGLQRPGKPPAAKRSTSTAMEHEKERRTEKMTLVMTPSVARKLRIMCAIEGTKPSAWIEKAIMAAPEPKI